MREPNILSLDEILRRIDADYIEREGIIYPARPVPHPEKADRVKAAWLVFRGKADAIVWPGGQ